MDVAEAHVVVTGASSGIGEVLARTFATAGANLTLVARREERLRTLASECVGRTHVVGHDLSVPERAADWIPGAVEALGPIDVLVNNAGVEVMGPTVEQDPEDGDRCIRLNLMTPLRLTRALLPSMLERRRGTIVDIASVAGLAPLPGMTWYNATKAGLGAASESLRGELRGTGVHVVAVYPGVIPATELGERGLRRFENSRVAQFQTTGTPDELARLVLDAVENGRDRVIYPASNALARSFPAITRWLIDRIAPIPEGGDA